MRRSLLVWSVALALATSVVAQQPKPDPSAELFAPAKAVPKFKITVDADNLKLLKKDPRAYVRCTVQVNGDTFENVGIHLKGAAGSYRDWDDRPALTLNFDKFKNGQKLKGLDKIHLNNSAQDGSVMNEILFSEMALAMGVPTARAGHAIVELNGRKMGLYGLKEGYNETFIKRHFPTATGGNLYDGGFLQDIDAELRLDNGKEEDKRKDLKALVKLCQERDAKKRYEAVTAAVDADIFITDTALQMLGGDWDGYPRQRNNYRLYFPPNGGKAVFFPHGKDQLWQNPQDALWHGWGGMVARAVLDHPDGKKQYIAKLKEVVEKQFDLEKLNKRIDEWSKPAKESLAATKRFTSASSACRRRCRSTCGRSRPCLSGPTPSAGPARTPSPAPPESSPCPP
jgi:spore coat protein H